MVRADKILFLVEKISFLVDKSRCLGGEIKVVVSMESDLTGWRHVSVE